MTAPKFPFIGVSGYARHGKGTVGIVAGSFEDFEDFSFAIPLKYLVFELFHKLIPEHMDFDALLTGNGRTDVARAILQVIGTDIYRKMDPEYWVKATEERVRVAKLTGTAGGYIPDMRFLNEVDYVEKQGGLLLFVKRPGFRDENTNYDHESEKWAPEIQKRCHITLLNIASQNALCTNADRIIMEYISGGIPAAVDLARTIQKEEGSAEVVSA